MRGMTMTRTRLALANAAIAAGVVLGSALGAEWFLGIVPCALCLLERWPWRIAVVIAVAGFFLARRPARVALALAGLVVLGGGGIAGLHVGVEAGLWPSPLPECAAPRFSGGSIAERLASMPARPAKPCDEPVYVVPGLPVSLAAMNLLASLAFSAAVAGFLWRSRRNFA
jgi:disulfide bond formation protein DsbB